MTLRTSELLPTVAVLKRRSIGGGGEIVAGRGGLARNERYDGAVHHPIVRQCVDAFVTDFRLAHHRQILIFQDDSRLCSGVPRCPSIHSSLVSHGAVTETNYCYHYTLFSLSVLTAIFQVNLG